MQASCDLFAAIGEMEGSALWLLADVSSLLCFAQAYSGSDAKFVRSQAMARLFMSPKVQEKGRASLKEQG